VLAELKPRDPTAAEANRLRARRRRRKTLPVENSMTRDDVFSFSDLCRKTLEPLLSQYGFSYVATYCRPRGMAVELAKNSHCLFAVCEGNVLFVDLILHRMDDQYFRVSLNQALWFNNVRTLLGLNSCHGQLGVFVREAATAACCIQFLSDDGSKIDDRYCFPMTASSRRQYLSLQRGE